MTIPPLKIRVCRLCWRRVYLFSGRLIPHPNLYGHIMRKNNGLLRLMWTLFLNLRLYPHHDKRRVLTRIAWTPPSAHALVMGCAMAWADQQSATVVLRTTM